MEKGNLLNNRYTTQSGKSVGVTAEDILNNPGVDPKQIAEVKFQYHLHRISSVTLSGPVLICTFIPDSDSSSLFYTPLERGATPVREYEVGEGEKGDVSITSDGLAVTFGDVYISSEEIWAAVPQ